MITLLKTFPLILRHKISIQNITRNETQRK